ncbi:MAG: hypothetical protein IT201_04700 [Thermoleophilia bacterium]|nr:hypothetical protein [Thermoleophilia bacterium]
MAYLLAFGLVLVLLALLPGLRRPIVLLALAGLTCALVARAITGDGFLIAAAGLVPILLALVAWEIADTFHVAAAPSREARRERRNARRADERRREARERERQRRLRERSRRAA